jgi:hypothetical protein
LFTVKGNVKTFGYESLSHAFDTLSGAEKGIGDSLVFPVGTVGIGFKENMGSPNFLRGAFELFDDGETNLTFVFAQPDNVNLWNSNLV